MQYIDDFFMGLLSKEEVNTFEERIKNDPAFAADVAFYISSRQVAKEMADDEKRARFREIYKPGNGYHHQEQPAKVVSMRRVMRIALAAAIIAAVVVTTFMWNRQSSASELASKYINKEYSKLDVHMGTADDWSKAVENYNNGKYKESEDGFEGVLAKDSGSLEVIRYAGVAALRAGDFDKALQHFRKMETFRARYNPAVLLQAVALMKRNQPGDKQEARSLLQRIIDNNLDGKETAQEWLGKW